MGKALTLPDAEIEVILAKIKAAREDAQKQSEIRKKNQDAYYRMPLGNEKEGRSKIVDTAVYNHVSGLHPHLMRRFLATDLKIVIKGDDPKVAKGLKQKIRDDIHDQGGYTLINDVLLDGEICHNGTAKEWWSRVWGEPDQREVVVTEEQLAQLVEDVRFSFGQEDIVQIPKRAAVINDGIPTAENPMGTEIEVEGAQMYQVNVTFRDLKESGPVIATVPPEQFLCERGKARINDRYGVGIERQMSIGELQRENERRSMPGEPYYTGLRDAAESGPTQSLSALDQERRDREDLSWNETAPPSAESLRKPGTVTEWCDWAEANGKLVPAIFTFLNDRKIRCEENEDGIIPYNTWSPTPTPHSIIGQSAAAPHVDSQNVRTVITRALLDNIAFTVDKPKWVRNRGTDMLGLQNITPGKILFGNPEDVKEIENGQLDYRMLQVLEYLKAESEERGPSTRLNQGVDSGPGGNDTATGIKIVQRASFSKIDLIAMAFSELFLVDLYNKLIILYQKNLDLPVVVSVDGEEITLSKKSIQGRYVAHSDLGAAVDFDDRAFGQASGQLNMMVSLLKEGVYPFSPSAMREQIKDVMVAGGKADPAKYLETTAPQPQGPPGAPQGPQGSPGPQGGPIGAPQSPQGDSTVVSGTEDPGAGMAAGE